jgi:hypothetical protein
MESGGDDRCESSSISLLWRKKGKVGQKEDCIARRAQDAMAIVAVGAEPVVASPVRPRSR